MPDPEPGDDWIAIRYNTMTDRAALNRSAQTAFVISGRRHYSLSMFTRPGMDAREVAIDVAPHSEVTTGRMRAVTLGALRAAGFLPTEYNPITGHIEIRLPGRPDDELWDHLVALMGPPERVPPIPPQG
jgi:hypothetical protein